MSLIDFYKNVVKSLGLKEKEGYIYSVDSKGNELPLMDGSKQVVLPTRKHLNSLIEEDEDGEIQVVKIPYNPLNEDVIKGDSISLKKTKTIVERRIGHSLAIVGELLLRLALDPKLQKKTNIEINKFLTSTIQAKNNNVKQTIDDLSVEKWREIYANTLTKSKGMVNIFIKKAGVSNGEKFNRLAVLDSAVYEEILKADKDTPVYDVKLRNKDIIIFKLLMEYLLPDMNSNNCIEVGSNDTECPAFIALYRMYINIISRTNRLINLLKHVDVSYESAILELPIKEDDLLSLNMFKNELVLIPNETDLNRPKVINKGSGIASIDGSLFNKPTGNPVGVSNNNAYPTNPVDYRPTEPEDPIDRILKNTQTIVTPVYPSYGQQQPVYQQPMSYSGLQQQQYNPQPSIGMYNQPSGMYGQPYQQPVYGGYNNGFSRPPMGTAPGYQNNVTISSAFRGY